MHAPEGSGGGGGGVIAEIPDDARAPAYPAPDGVFEAMVGELDFLLSGFIEPRVLVSRSRDVPAASAYLSSVV